MPEDHFLIKPNYRPEKKYQLVRPIYRLEKRYCLINSSYNAKKEHCIVKPSNNKVTTLYQIQFQVRKEILPDKVRLQAKRKEKCFLNRKYYLIRPSNKADKRDFL